MKVCVKICAVGIYKNFGKGFTKKLTDNNIEILGYIDRPKCGLRADHIRKTLVHINPRIDPIDECNLVLYGARADIIIVDLEGVVPGVDFETIYSIQKVLPEKKIIAITKKYCEYVEYSMERVFANGYIFKTMDIPAIVASINQVHAGQNCFNPPPTTL